MNSVSPNWGLNWRLSLILGWWFGAISWLPLLTVHDPLQCINLCYIRWGWCILGWFCRLTNHPCLRVNLSVELGLDNKSGSLHISH